MQIAGAKILLTGATGGLGHAIARELAARGGSLILTGRKVDVLEPLAKEIAAKPVACDLSDRVAVGRLAEENSDVDIMVANAGLPGSGTFRDLSDEEVDRVLDVNLRAPIVMAHSLGQKMADRGRGQIVFVSSVAGLVASPNTSMYNATKFGLRGFAHALRLDMESSGVGVSVVLPGFIRDAGMFADAQVELPPGTRTKSPIDVARAVASCIEDNRGEMLVAPFELRLGSKVGGFAPSISALVQKTSIARRTSSSLAAAQRDIK